MTERLTNLWPAPLAAQPLNATVTVPGSKSLSNRYLILAALGSKPVTLIGLLRSRDTDLMMGALEALGVRCDVDSATDTTVTVTPPVSGRFHGNVNVFCGLAGTVMRFVPGLALFADGPVNFDGDEQAYARPMKPVLDGLEQLGATVDYHGEVGRLPFTITPPATLPSAQAQVSIDSSGSSQFISGLLLISSKLPSGLHLAHTGEKTPSLPHIRMTVADVTIEMDDAQKNRFVWLYMEPDYMQWLDWAAAHDIEPKVMEFISTFPDYLSQQNEDDINATPRSYERISSILRVYEERRNTISKAVFYNVICGNVGKVIAQEFVNFIESDTTPLISYDDVFGVDALSQETIDKIENESHTRLYLAAKNMLRRLDTALAHEEIQAQPAIDRLVEYLHYYPVDLMIGIMKEIRNNTKLVGACALENDSFVEAYFQTYESIG